MCPRLPKAAEPLATTISGKTSAFHKCFRVLSIHGVGSVVGATLTGVFATTSVNSAGADGRLYGNPRLIPLQGISVMATAGLAVAGTGAIMMALKSAIGLRPAQLDEARGIDDIEHGGGVYALGGRFAHRDRFAHEKADCDHLARTQRAINELEPRGLA
jgi:ammonia channel protein AmtB